MTNPVEISDSPEFRDADPNGLAIAYMAVLEKSSVARVIITGAPYAKAVTETNTFLSSAEGELVDNFLDLQKPVLDRLYIDLVAQPVSPRRDNALEKILRVWGKKGEFYKYWASHQGTRYLPGAEPEPDRRKGDFAELPAEYWRKSDIAKLPSVSATTPQQLADMQFYNQRYRNFYDLPSDAHVDYDPYLDFKIRFSITTKFRDAGPFATAMAVQVMLRGGSPDEVAQTLDAASAVDGFTQAWSGLQKGGVTDAGRAIADAEAPMQEDAYYLVEPGRGRPASPMTMRQGMP